MTEIENKVISDTARKAIDACITKYPQGKKRAALISALHIVREEEGGWLSRQSLDAVAEYLELPPIAVYEVATFYNMYELEPIGKHKISICNNISCMLRGSEKIMAHVEKRCGAKMGETSKDGMYTLRETECLAACIGAPAMQIDDKHYYENLTPERIDEILETLKGKEKLNG